MSINLLESPDAFHKIQDDQESAYWVILWVLLLFSTIYTNKAAIADFAAQFDDWKEDGDGSIVGGKGKINFLLRGWKRLKPNFEGKAALQELVKTLGLALSERYTPAAYAEREERQKQAARSGRIRDEELPFPTAFPMKDSQWIIDKFEKALGEGRDDISTADDNDSDDSDDMDTDDENSADKQRWPAEDDPALAESNLKGLKKDVVEAKGGRSE